MAHFGAVTTAMVTPFSDDGALDVDTAVALARWLAEHGNDGLVVAGTTGEGPVLTDDERLELWRAVAEAVSVPVVAGTGTNDTAHSVELERMRSYAPRLAAALERVERGEREWVARPLIDSYHSVWHELHEDLLLTLDIDRSAEQEVRT